MPKKKKIRKIFARIFEPACPDVPVKTTITMSSGWCPGCKSDMIHRSQRQLLTQVSFYPSPGNVVRVLGVVGVPLCTCTSKRLISLMHVSTVFLKHFQTASNLSSKNDSNLFSKRQISYLRKDLFCLIL